jgi:hypothetical protein
VKRLAASSNIRRNVHRQVTFDEVWSCKCVAVEKDQHVAVGGACTRIGGRGASARSIMMYDHKIERSFGFAKNVARIVGRAVVDDDDLGLQCLRAKRRQR